MVNTKIRLTIFFVAKDGEALNSQQKQDWELTAAQIMNSLSPNSLKKKKIGKTTRPFRYDLNQFSYDYTVEVTNSFKGLDLIDRVPEELWMEARDIVQEAGRWLGIPISIRIFHIPFRYDLNQIPYNYTVEVTN